MGDLSPVVALVDLEEVFLGRVRVAVPPRFPLHRSIAGMHDALAVFDDPLAVAGHLTVVALSIVVFIPPRFTLNGLIDRDHDFLLALVRADLPLHMRAPATAVVLAVGIIRVRAGRRLEDPFLAERLHLAQRREPQVALLLRVALQQALLARRDQNTEAKVRPLGSLREHRFLHELRVKFLVVEASGHAVSFARDKGAGAVEHEPSLDPLAEPSTLLV